jgi:hypothetical protein
VEREADDEQRRQRHRSGLGGLADGQAFAEVVQAEDNVPIRVWCRCWLRWMVRLANLDISRSFAA